MRYTSRRRGNTGWTDESAKFKSAREKGICALNGISRSETTEKPSSPPKKKQAMKAHWCRYAFAEGKATNTAQTLAKSRYSKLKVLKI